MPVLYVGLICVFTIQSNIYDQFEQVIKKQDIKAFKTLVNQCNSFDKDGYWRGILLSSYGDNLAGLEFLIEKGEMTVNEANYFGKTVLHDACQKGNAEVIEYLLRKKAYVNAYRIERGNSYSFSPLDDALKYVTCEKCIELLVRHGAYANQDRIIEFFKKYMPTISACQALKSIMSPYTKNEIEKDLLEMQNKICVSGKDIDSTGKELCKRIQERIDILK
jgi:ankyrin repeat protein